MCSAFFAFKAQTELLFLLAFNRDEFFDRPTAPAGFWEDDKDLVAGMDLQRKGTWLGCTRQGRFAFLTNFREADPNQLPNAPSRGELASKFLLGVSSPTQYLLELEAAEYNGFNLVVGDLSTGDVAYLTNREDDGIVRLVPGTYGISNAALNCAWPKVFTGKDALQAILEEQTFEDGKVPWETVFERVLGSRQVTEDAQLPRTGLDLDWERQLSPVFLEPMETSGDSGMYGTRSQTILAVFKNGRASLKERTIFADGSHDDVQHSFAVDLSRRTSRELAKHREVRKLTGAVSTTSPTKPMAEMQHWKHDPCTLSDAFANAKPSPARSAPVSGSFIKSITTI